MELALRDIYGEHVGEDQLQDHKATCDKTAHYLDLSVSLQCKRMLKSVIMYMNHAERSFSGYETCIKHLELFCLFDIEQQPCLLFELCVYELKRILTGKMCTMMYRYFIRQCKLPSIDHRHVSFDFMRLFMENAPHTKCQIDLNPFITGWHIPDTSEVISVFKEWLEFDLTRCGHIDSLCNEFDFKFEDIESLCAKQLILNETMKVRLFRIVQIEQDYISSELEVNEYSFRLRERFGVVESLKGVLTNTNPLFR